MKIKRPVPRTRRVAPPTTSIDLYALPRMTLLTQAEVSTIIRKSQSTLEKWRRNPDHALRWTRIDGWPRVRAGDLIDYIESVAGVPHPLTDKPPCQPRR